MMDQTSLNFSAEHPDMAPQPNIKSPKSAVALFNSKLNPEAYNHVATRASLVTVQLVSSSFDVNPTFFSKNDQVKLDLCHTVSAIDFYDDTLLVAGIFKYELIAKVGRKHVMTTKADFLTAYDLPEGSVENESKAFCARVGLFAAYPYFRALFSHLGSVSNIDVPILPVLSADPLKRREGRQTAKMRRRQSEKETK